MSEPLPARLYTFLARHHVLTLSYQDGEGPGACALWFVVSPSLCCYFLSSPSTRHGTALVGGGQVAFTVQKDDQAWQAIQGVQGRGHCTPLTAARQEEAWALYLARFPFVREQFADLEAALARTILWEIRPAWLRLIDNTLGFGHREELVLDGGDFELCQ